MHTLCRWPGRPLDTVICGQKKRQSQMAVNLQSWDLTIALWAAVGLHGASASDPDSRDFPCAQTKHT